MGWSLGKPLGELFGIKWNPIKDIQNMFSAPKINLPTIDLSALNKVETKEVAPLPLLEPEGGPKKRKKGIMDIGSFSSNLTPTIQAILGLSIPPVSPGLMIPGAKT